MYFLGKYLIEYFQVFDDSMARAEWGWEHKIPLEKLVEIMITNLRTVYNK